MPDIRAYQPFTYSLTHIHQVSLEGESPLPLKVLKAAGHALLGLVGCFVEIFGWAAKHIYCAIVPEPGSGPDRVDNIASRTFDPLIRQEPVNRHPEPVNTDRPSVPPEDSSVRLEEPSILRSLLPPHSIPDSAPVNAPPQQMDIAPQGPSWKETLSPREVPVFTLDRLMPLSFNSTTPIIDDGHGVLTYNPPNTPRGVAGFTLKAGTTPLYHNQNIDLNPVPPTDTTWASEYPTEEAKNYTTINVQCDALDTSAMAQDLHCSPSAPVNLKLELRQSYNIHPDAKSYRFIYPVQFDPDQLETAPAALANNRDIPPFLKGLCLIGGYAYYDQNNQLIQVKAFSADPSATERLETAKAIDIENNGLFLPRNVTQAFLAGVDMTNRHEQGITNLKSPYANVITAPSLQAHLSHFAYIPQSFYENTGYPAADQAPFGGFLYRTKTSQLQFVPIGSDAIVPPTANTQRAPSQQATPCPLEMLIKSIFYPQGALIDADTVRTLRQAISRQVRIESNRNRNITIFLPENKQIIVQSNGTILTQPLDNPEETYQIFMQHLVNKTSEMMDLRLSGMNQKDTIYTVLEAVPYAPLQHLETLTSSLTDQNTVVDYKIKTFNIPSQAFIAIDAGGPFRNYITQLFSGLASHSPIFSRDGQDPATLTARYQPENQQHLQNLGKLLGWLYKKPGNPYPIGQEINPQILQELFACLQAVNWNDRDDRINLQLLRAIKDTKVYYEQEIINNIITNQTLDKNNQIILNILLYGLEIDETKIHQLSQQQLKNLLIDYFVGNIREIGRGFAHIAPLERRETLDRFQTKLVGVFNRQSIANHIIYIGDLQAVQNKARWIKNWILNSQTKEKEIQDFLFAVSGGRTMPPDRQIQICAVPTHYERRYPGYHTCFWRLDIPHGPMLDNLQNGSQATEKQFINVLKESITHAIAGGLTAT